jgi:hypothetical protein
MDNQSHVAPALPAPARPTAITVFGIVGIVLAALGLLCSPMNLIGLSDPNNPVINIAGFKAVAIFGAINGILCAVALLAISIGLLNLKRWARSGAVVYAVYTIVMGVLGITIMIVLFVPHLGTGHDPIMQAGMIGGLIGGVVGGLIGMIFPILLLIFMRKPKIVAACCK